MKLDAIRKKLDQIDGELLDLLSTRLRLAQKAGIIKKDHSRPIEDKNREEEVLITFIRKGDKLRLSKFFVRQLFNLIINESKRIQGKV